MKNLLDRFIILENKKVGFCGTYEELRLQNERLFKIYGVKVENRANYFFVGLFVFGVFFASLGFILWLGGYSKEESFKYY
ncbi:hypothetical protein OLS58_05580, partial [Campylobacter jejuni]|nr:hypothetical protein [Campylobacter jejuni]